MRRRALADDLANNRGMRRFLDIESIATATGTSRKTVEREIVPYLHPYKIGRRNMYHVKDLAALFDPGGEL